MDTVIDFPVQGRLPFPMTVSIVVPEAENLRNALSTMIDYALLAEEEPWTRP